MRIKVLMKIKIILIQKVISFLLKKKIKNVVKNKFSNYYNIISEVYILSSKLYIIFIIGFQKFKNNMIK